MAKLSNNNLLIIGEMFKTEAGEFKIIRRLGQGATGEVYQAQSRDGKRMVAIKMMRPTDMQLARKLFIGEGLTLQYMRSAEIKHRDGFFVTPEYFGADDKTDTPYIVEEFMTGKPFPDLVSGGHLSEEDVVAIGVQLFRTLHLLSKDLKKNYIDLKFTDLWWDQEKKILKITDWGTLEETNHAGQARDMLRAGLYIYRLATGRPITESRGILNQVVNAYPEWEQLSWGLQEILRRLLHPNPSARVGDELLLLDSMEKIAQEFRNLDEYWKGTVDELLTDIRLSVDAAQKSNPEKEIEQQTRHYRLARTALEIASKRGIPNKEYDDRLRAIVVDESDYYTRAHNLYEGTSYAPARKLFQIGARLLSSSKLRRWAWLANAGALAREESYRKVKVLAESAVELMEQEQYEEAINNPLDAALKILQSESLQTLRKECEVMYLIQQAVSAQRDSQYEVAAKACDSAYEIWSNTEEHDEWKDKVGDLLEQAKILRIRDANQKRVNGLLELAKTAEELIIILDNFHEALGLDPGNLKIYKSIAEKAGERFDSGLLEDAAQILWVGGRAPSVPPEYMDWHCPQEIRLALEPEKGHLSNASPYVPLIRHDENALPYKLAIVFFEKHFIPSANVLGLDRDDVIADLITNLDPERGKKMKEQVYGWRKEILRANKEKVNQLVAEAEGLLFADRPGTLQGLSIGQALACSQNRLQEVEKALGLLDQASRLAGSEDEAVKSKMKELNERGGDMKDELSQSFNESEKQKEETIATLMGKAEEILAQLKQLEDASPMLSKAGLSSQISDSMGGFQAERLGKVYELCTHILDLDSENQWALQTQQDIKGKIQGLGDFATLAVVSQKNVLDAAVEALLREAQGHYQDAKVLDAARSLRKIESLDMQASSRKSFMELKAKVATLLGVKYWEQENKAKLEEGEFSPHFLERVESHFSTEIPQQFRRDSISLKYLFAARSKLFTQLLKSNPASDVAEFTETLRNLVWTDNLYRCGLVWKNSEKADQKNGKWDGKKFVRNVLQANKKGNLGEKMEKLLAGLPIFLNPEMRSAELTSELVDRVIANVFKPQNQEANLVSEAPVSSDKVIKKPQQTWWKWVLIGVGLLALIGIAFKAGSYIINLAQTATPLPATNISEVPPAVDTPTFLPTDTPSPTFTQTLTPTSSPLATLCANQNTNIRAEPKTGERKAGLAVGSCLIFDARIPVASEIWVRVASNQTVKEQGIDVYVGGCWIKASFLLPKDTSQSVDILPLIPISSTALPVTSNP